MFIDPSIYIHPSIYTHPSGKKSFTLPCVLIWSLENMVTTWGPLTSAEICQITIALCSALVVKCLPSPHFILTRGKQESTRQISQWSSEECLPERVTGYIHEQTSGKEGGENHEKSKSLSSFCGYQDNNPTPSCPTQAVGTCWIVDFRALAEHACARLILSLRPYGL